MNDDITAMLAHRLRRLADDMSMVAEELRCAARRYDADRTVRTTLVSGLDNAASLNGMSRKCLAWANELEGAHAAGDTAARAVIDDREGIDE